MHIGSHEIRRCINYDYRPMHVRVKNMGSRWKANLSEKENEVYVKCRGGPPSNKYEMRWNAYTPAVGRWKSGASRYLPSRLVSSYMQRAGQAAASEEEQLKVSTQPEEGRQDMGSTRPGGELGRNGEGMGRC